MLLHSGVQPHSLCRHICHQMCDNSFAGVTFVLIWEIWSVFTIRNPILNNCLSPHLNLLSPHVANGDKVGQHWSITTNYNKNN